MTNRLHAPLAILGWLLLSAAAMAPAAPVGWDQDDFIISGAPNFPQYIGVFNHDFTFKGYLETNFLGVQGMDFDASGNLVAIASLSTHPEVRIYSPSGARIGGFVLNNPMLQYTGDIKVAPNGNYALGSYMSGVQVYTPQGTFVAQYGDGDSRAVEYVPGNRLWSGGAGTTIKIFDTDTGIQVGSFTADKQTMSYSMEYSSTTNTVLVVDEDRDLGGVYERDLTGALLREFHVPQPQVNCYTATRGPGDTIFGTDGLYRIDNPNHMYYDAVRWSADGTVATPILFYPVQISAVRILWAGNVPEPGTGLLILSSAAAIFARRPPTNRR